MKSFQHGKTILIISVPLVLLLVVVSSIGLFTENFYSKETFNWQVQSVGQDMIDLFVITLSLIITAVFSYRRNDIAPLLWAGTVLYILYTFIIFCFAVHFNKLFLLYCSILGISLYSLTWFAYSSMKRTTTFFIKKKSVIIFTGIYFLVIAVMFLFLWLSEIVPAINNDTVPDSLTVAGLFTNPVHVIDLSVFLPGIFITGVWVLKKRAIGFLLAQVLLVFFILMDITIGWLSFMMYQNGLAADLSVAIAMAALAVISAALLTWNLINIKIE
jgi:hypothetical protein